LQTAARLGSSADGASTQDTGHRPDTGWTATAAGAMAYDKAHPARLPVKLLLLALLYSSMQTLLPLFAPTHFRPGTHCRLRGPSPVILSYLWEARHYHGESNNRFRFDMACPPAPAVARNELPTRSIDARMRCARLQKTSYRTLSWTWSLIAP
jgi:hypothetical protein